MYHNTVRPLNTGFIPVYPKKCHYHHSVVSYYPNISDEKQVNPVFIFLIEHESGYCLVDTGMSSTERAQKYHDHDAWQEPGTAVQDHLEKLGIACEDVGTVILTHMHWDHVYNLEKFAHARIIAHEKEKAFAYAPNPLFYKNYEHQSLGIKAPFIDLQIETCAGEVEILPGVRVFETHGHSPGHISVEVDTKQGKYILAGDSAFRLDNFKEIPEMGFTVTPPEKFADIVGCCNSLELQKNRCEDLSHIFMTHEVSLLERCDKTPVFGV